MKVLRQIQSLILIWGLIAVFSLTAIAQTSFVNLDAVDVPPILISGQSHIFKVEIQNTTEKPITISLLPGFRWELYNGKNLEGGIAGYSKSDSAKICRDSLATANDFVTLQANERRKFEVAVNVPKYFRKRKAIACFSFISECEGKNLGYEAWIGETLTWCFVSRFQRSKAVK